MTCTFPTLTRSRPELVDDQAEIAERARKLFAGPIVFLKSAPKLEHLPEPTVPEIAVSIAAQLVQERATFLQGSQANDSRSMGPFPIARAVELKP